MTELKEIDLRALTAGNKKVWNQFVAAAAPLINVVVRRALSPFRLGEDDVMDTAQDVFVRLCANDFRVIKSYDPSRAAISTWLAVVARSAAIDHMRKRKRIPDPIDEVPEGALAVEDRHIEKLKIPLGLLTERQTLMLRLLYDEDRDVVEVAEFLKIDAQTVRSTHHKALMRLREYFRIDST